MPAPETLGLESVVTFRTFNLAGMTKLLFRYRKAIHLAINRHQLIVPRLLMQASLKLVLVFIGPPELDSGLPPFPRVARYVQTYFAAFTYSS